MNILALKILFLVRMRIVAACTTKIKNFFRYLVICF